MDKRVTTHRHSTLLTMWLTEAVLFLSVCSQCGLAEQPPSVHATGQRPTLTLIDPSQPLVFPEQQWNLVAPNRFGPTMAIWTIEPFRGVDHPQDQVDAGIFLNTQIRGKSSDWSTVIQHDRTSYLHQYTTARVAAATPGGNGHVGITVTFMSHEQPIVAGGDYVTTVTATITEVP